MFRSSALLALVLAGLVTQECMARPAEGRVWFGLGGRYAGYAMKDINYSLNNFSQDTGLVMAEINHGPGFQGELGFVVADRAGITFNYERAFARSSFEDGTGRIDYELDANLAWLGVDSFLGDPGGTEVVFSAGAGVVSTRGRFALAAYGVGAGEVDVRATGFLGMATVGLEVPLGDVAALSPYVGYRHANAGKQEVEGIPMPTATANDIDYSGVLGGVRLRLWTSAAEPAASSSQPGNHRQWNQDRSAEAGRYRLTYWLPRAGVVEIAILDVQQRPVRVLEIGEALLGHQEVHWDGRDFHGFRAPAGEYSYRVRCSGVDTASGLITIR